MSDFIVLFDDQFGRPSYARTEDPVALLAERIVDRQLTTRQLDGVVILRTSPVVGFDAAHVASLAARIRTAEEARMSPESLRRRLAKGKVTPEHVEEVRALLQARHPDEDFGHPWPIVQARDYTNSDEPT